MSRAKSELLPFFTRTKDDDCSFQTYESRLMFKIYNIRMHYRNGEQQMRIGYLKGVKSTKSDQLSWWLVSIDDNSLDRKSSTFGTHRWIISNLTHLPIPKIDRFVNCVAILVLQTNKIDQVIVSRVINI